MNQMKSYGFLNKYYSFDIIKIVASIFIVFHHYQQLSNSYFSGINFYGGIIPFNRLVELFFLISGALIYISDNKKNGENKLKILFKRIVRFYPISIIAFLVIFVVAEIQFRIFRSFPTDIDYHNLKCIFTSLTLTHRGWPILACERAINNPTWYISVLICCYVVYYLMLKISEILKIRIELLAFLFVVLIILIDYYYCDYFYYIGVDSVRGFKCFFIGFILAYISQYISSIKKLFIIDILLIILGGGIAYFVRQGRSIFVIYYCLSLMVFTLLVGERCIRFSISKKMDYTISLLTSASYEVYILHVPLYAMLNLVYMCMGIILDRSYISMIVFLIFVEIISVYIYRYIDKPLNSILCKKFLK
ncbi:MAG: acyltransferase [Ruminococcus sp.]|nr:acyltransferase [Ruminococcus sp.]